MGLFPLKGRSGFLGHTRQTLAEIQQLARAATTAATQTLQKLTQSPITIEAARVSLAPRDQIATTLVRHEDAELAAKLPVSGAHPGVLVTLFSKKDALELVALLLGRPAGTVKKFGDLEESAIAEMTNIALNGAINRVAEDGGVRFTTGVPAVVQRPKDLAGLFTFDAPADHDHALVIESRWHEATRDIHGSLVLVFALAGTPDE